MFLELDALQLILETAKFVLEEKRTFDIYLLIATKCPRVRSGVEMIIQLSCHVISKIARHALERQI